MSVRLAVNGHGCHTALHLGVKAKGNQENQGRVPKLHTKPYKARFIANSSSCTTTERSKLSVTCLTAVKNVLLSTVKRYMKDPV